MRYNNGKEVKRIKRLFYQISGLIAVFAIVMFILNLMLFGLISIGIFGLWFLFYQVADFHYVEFISDENRIVLRYYKAVTLSRPEYNSIEFQQQMLKNVVFESSILGSDSDVTFSIMTKRGIADYPSVSLLNVPRSMRVKIKNELFQILKR